MTQLYRRLTIEQNGAQGAAEGISLRGFLRSCAVHSILLMALFAGALLQQAHAEEPFGSASVAVPAGSTLGSPTMVGSTLKMIGGLCFCLGLLAVGVRILKRLPGYQSPSHRRRIEIREKVALSGKASLFLVAVDNREYLITSGSDSTCITPTNSMTTPLFAESLDEICEESGELHA